MTAARKLPADPALFQQIATPQLRKGDMRKIEILHAAIECIGTLGYDHTNFETIGQRCGMKRPHVAYHFPDRKALIQAVIRYVYAAGQQIIVAKLKSARRAEDQIKAYVEGVFQWLETYPHHQSVIGLLLYLSTIDADFQAVSQEVKRIALERLTSILQGKVSGEEVERTFAIISGEVLYWTTYETNKKTAPAVRRTIEAVQRLI